MRRFQGQTETDLTVYGYARLPGGHNHSRSQGCRMEAFTKQIGLCSKEGGTLYGTLHCTGRTRTRRSVTSTYWSRSESQSGPSKVVAPESRSSFPRVVALKFFRSAGFVYPRSLAKPEPSLSTPSAGNSCGGLAFDTAHLLPRIICSRSRTSIVPPRLMPRPIGTRLF